MKTKKYVDFDNEVQEEIKQCLPQFGIVQATNPSCLLYFP